MSVDSEFHFTPYPQIGEQFSSQEWNAIADKLYQDFPEGGLIGVLPPHFVRATFPKIGGRVIFASEENLTYWGLLLPGNDNSGRSWTLRCHWKGSDNELRQRLRKRLNAFISTNVSGLVNWFEVDERRQKEFDGRVFSDYGDGVSIQFPSGGQAQAAQDLHRKIWRVEDLAFLYPFDLYHPDAGTATRLVAVSNDDEVAGFLFGFYGHGQQWFGSDEGYRQGTWIESQLLGVDENYRQAGIAKRLKLAQRSLALNENIQIVHWTVDPLQAGNAWLNFNHLGAVSVQFYPEYYKFHNALNRVPASRIGVSWVLNSQRTKECVLGQPLNYSYNSLVRDFSTEIVTPIDTKEWMPIGDNILVEIPQDWTKMQRTQPELALQWRDSSDRIFQKLLCQGLPEHAIIGITKDGRTERVFLVARRITP
jgi:predicted GNAT superfamily acetyltransferase